MTAGTGPAHATGNPMLHAEVGTQADGEAFAISLKDSAGQGVQLLGAGDYDVEVDDWAAIHNFDLLTPANASLIQTEVESVEHFTTTVTLTAGAWKFRCDPHPTLLRGSFTVVSALAADGSGTLDAGTSAVSAGSTGNTVTFTFTAAAGGMGDGTITLEVPAGWSAPSQTPNAAGYVTTSKGSVGVSDRTITISALTLTSGQTATVTYGAKSSGGPGAVAPSPTGMQEWTATERSGPDGTLAPISASPEISVVSANGSGTMDTPTAAVSAGAGGQTLSFTYTAAAGGMSAGAVTLTVPSGWSAPSITGTAAGYTTATAGNVSVSGQKVTISGLSLSGGDTVTATYGDRGSGGGGASTTGSTGTQSWAATERSTAGGTLTALGASPQIAVKAADGSGTMDTPTSVLSAASTGNDLAFTFTAPVGGMSSGAVTLTAPGGWSAPSTDPDDPGFVDSDVGTVAVAGQKITVSALTLSSGQTVTIDYQDATASSSSGTQTFAAAERSSPGGTLTPLGSSPQIAVKARDGSGTMDADTSAVPAGSSGHTISFTYTAASGGTASGAVTVLVPAGWTAPSTSDGDPGFASATSGNVSVAGQKIVVSALTLGTGQSVTITYESATASAATGTQPWTATERSAPGGALTALDDSPDIAVKAPDGSGTMSTQTTVVSASASARTISFTYSAAQGGTASGAVSLTVPTGWSAPSTIAADPGYVTSTAGAVSVSDQTVTVAGISLAASATVTVVYGSRAGGGPGATAAASTGLRSWSASERSTPVGGLTALASSPAIRVVAPDGSGTLATPTAAVAYHSIHNSIAFTYTAATGGVSGGRLAIAVPTGWSPPSTNAADEGYTKATRGTVSVSGRLIVVSGLVLSSGGAVTVTYGSRAGGGPGATSPAAAGSQLWQGSEKSTDGGVRRNVPSPRIGLLSRDGSGTMKTPTRSVKHGSRGQTLVFTYTAAAGGTAKGTVQLTVPSGWSAPSTVATAAGFATASAGTLTVAGRIIRVSGLTLAGAAALTITYGSRAGGGPGANAPAAVAGKQMWTAAERSNAAGVLAPLAVSPTVTVA